MAIISLDARNVLSLPVGDWIDGPDPEAKRVQRPSGLVLRVRSARSRTYYVRYGIGGKRVKLGNAYFMAVSDAREKARAILGRVAEGEDPQAEKAEEKRIKREKTSTFQELAERLLEEADLAPTTRYNWERLLAVRVYPVIGARAPAGIERRDVRDLVQKVAAETPTQANDVLKVTRWVFARAIEKDLLPSSPCAGLKKPTKERERDIRLTDAQIEKLWNAAGGAEVYGRAVRFAMLTAARRGEVFEATWSEIDEKSKVWRVPAARMKARVSHEVPLCDMAVELLDDLKARGCGPADGPWLFPGRQRNPKRGEPGDLQAEDNAQAAGKAAQPTSKAWDRLLVAAKIIEAPTEEGDEDAGRRPWTANPVRFHDLRRTVRDRMTHELGVAVPVAEACIGHTAPKLIRTYSPSGVSMKDKRAAFDRWARSLRKIVSGEQQPGKVVAFVAGQAR